MRALIRRLAPMVVMAVVPHLHAADLASDVEYPAPIAVAGEYSLVTTYGPGAEPAVVSGNISGNADAVLTVSNTGGGTVSFRGDNSGFLGSVTLTGGGLDITNRAAIPSVLSRLELAGSAANRAVLRVGEAGTVTVDGGGTTAERLAVGAGMYAGIDPGSGSFVFSNGKTLKGVAGNTTLEEGGAVFLATGANLVLGGTGGGRVVFAGNEARYGGAISTETGSVITGTGVDFMSNKANAGTYSYIGGAIWNRGTLSFDDSTFTNNLALNGGAVYNENATAAFTNTLFSGNQATYSYGGAIYNVGTGGRTSTVTIDGGILSDNWAYYQGGAVYTLRADVAISGSSIANNTADGNGGGLYNNDGTVDITATEIRGNFATSNGGGLYNDATMILDGGGDGITVASNTAGRDGGGIYNNDNIIGVANLTVTNVEFAGNRAGASSRGGGIYNQNGTVTLTDSSFQNNYAGRGGAAIYNWNGQVAINVSNNKTVTFAGNTTRDGANSIHIESRASGGIDAEVALDVGDDAVLDIRDPMSGVAGDSFFGPGTITVRKTGNGELRLGGASAFTVGARADGSINFIHSGDLRFYRAGEVVSGNAPVEAGAIHLEGANSVYSIVGPGNIHIGGGNAISITDDADNWQSAALQGTIDLVANPTFSFDMREAVAGEAMLAIRADTITIAAGTIVIDIYALAQSSGDTTTYLLVEKENVNGVGDFDSSNVTLDLRLRGRNIAEAGRASIGAGGNDMFTVETEGDRIFLTVNTDRPDGINKVLDWSPAGSGTVWSLGDKNWVERGTTDPQIEYFVQDVVNFTAAGGGGTVEVGDNGVTVAGMYVSGDQDYTFTGEGIEAVDGSIDLTGTATRGKLVLGQVASSDADGVTAVAPSEFTGTVDFTGIAGENRFAGGIEIHSGTLRISAGTHIDPGLGETSFLGDSAAYDAVTQAVQDQTSTADDIAGAVTAAFPALRLADSITFDNAAGEQRLAVADGKAGSIFVETGKHAVFQNAVRADLDGGAVSVGAGGLLVLNGEADSLYRFRNNQASSGGALSSGGTLYLHNGEFGSNSAGLGGGAIRLTGGAARIDTATFDNNQSGGDGGAVMADNNATADIRDATFTGNHAGGRGGAIFSDGDLSLRNVSFLNNSAVGRGGAVYATSDVSLTMDDGERHVISGNRDSGGAGSIHLDAGSGDAALDIDVTGGSTLDIRDPLSGAGGGGTMEVSLNADPDGTILLGGSNVFSGDGTRFTAVGGTIRLYRDGETPDGTRNDPAGPVGAGAIVLDGAGTAFILGDGITDTLLEVGGNNRIAAETVTFTDNTTVQAGVGHDNVAALSFSPATIQGTAAFVADAGKTLVLRGQIADGGTLLKTGGGEVFLAELGNRVETLDVREGVLGVMVGDDVAVDADNVVFASGTGLDIRGFSGYDGEEYTVIQSGAAITQEPDYVILVGGQTDVDFLTVSARLSGDETAIVVGAGLTWYDQATDADGNYTDAHGTFTLADAGDPFIIGSVLADRTGAFLTGWDGKTLTKRGQGQLVLAGDNTYTGATVIEEGTLTVTGLGGAGLNQTGLAVDNNGVFNLDIDASSGGDFNRTIAGSGAVVKDGDGSVRLTGDNAGLSGTVTVREGELIADNRSAFGTGPLALQGNAVLDFDGTFANEVSGAGVLTSRGDILFTGHHASHTGCTIIDSGTASLADGFASGANFSVYGTLAGNGRIGSLTVRSGGTLSPGYSIGTVTATGSARFETGSTYVVEIDVGQITPAAPADPTNPAEPSETAPPETGFVSDLLVVGGVTTIESGAILEVTGGGLHLFSEAESPDPVRIIHGSHFADDTLFTLVSRSIGLSIRQEILADGYYLYLGKTAPDFVDLLQGYGTPNARRAAAAFTDIVARGDGHLTGGLYGYIASLPNDPARIADAFQQVHGEVFAAGQDAVLRMHRTQRDAARRARQAAVEQRRACPGLTAPGWLNDAVAWSTATGSWSDRRHDRGYSGHDLATGGFALGLDKAIRDAWFLGAALGYDRGRQRFDTIRSRDDIESFRVGLYGGYSRHGWDVDAHLGYSRNRHKTRRDINLHSAVASFAASPNARYHDDLLSVGVGVGRDIEWGDWFLRPSAGLEYAHLWTSRIRERGTSQAELGADRSTAYVFDATIGVGAGRDFRHNGVTWTPELRADYTRHLGDKRASVRTHFLSVPDVPFVAESGRWSRNTGRLGASLEARWRDRFSVRAAYDFEVGERYTGHQVSVAFGMTW